MTPTDEKALAEKAAKFLKLEHDRHAEVGGNGEPYWWFAGDSITENEFWNHDLISPALAHLAKREMEKRGFWWRHEGKAGEYYCFFTKEISLKPSEWNELYVQHENEFVALWKAIEQTGVMDD